MFACFLLGSLLAYGLVTAIYRLHIHPLSKFPGPPLAAMTGLYEIYFAAWGAGSFEDEIDRMHEEYGPVVRITPDEIHVQEQFYNSKDADCWIKGTKALDARRHRSGCTTPRSLIRKRSISRVRSILQVEVHQIIRGLVQKHQVHRVLSARFRPFVPVAGHQEIRVNPLEESDLEDGHPSACRSMPKSQRGHRLLQLSDSADAEWPVSQETNCQALHSTAQRMSRRSLPL
ncbi:uncharacterized protein N7459_004392 [Penicillium hispanicum]|uniref:uncharacterized protein n=1 Tax=Penicillium hispanicum TaxID=1080232 RepID=UPI0025403BBC|nr:uncharacterized protein N7459_004392 [Penicillium hispanicum]KAJ5584592.1 hypothetical protein N7459_004392 [Penicillium hispanicum]